MAPAAAPPQANSGYIPQRGLFSSGQQPAQAGYAPPPAQNGGGFFGTLFRGFAAPAAYQPAAPDYQPQPPGYAPSGQGDMANPQNYQIDPQYERQTVNYPSDEPAGTVVVDTPNKFLYLVEGGGKAMRYGIGVGRPGFTWAGTKTITAKKEWPDWRPPSDMLQRRPDLPRYMPGGEDNPLGARAMYLGSTLYRIHGSNEPWTIGTNVSSGCIRMRNQDVEDLYDRVKVGTKVVVI
jgi:lipoprotein-anchoring transpeptidase ErfK/SrfK